MSALDQPWLHDLVTVLSAPTVMLSEPSGQVRDGGSAEGVLHADVRVLSLAVLTVGGTSRRQSAAGWTARAPPGSSRCRGRSATTSSTRRSGSSGSGPSRPAR